MRFKLLNNISGWIMFVIAATVYAITAEPTVSLWDCGEFISACYKMHVVHPPGAPLFLMIGRVFSLFAGSPEKVAYMINFMSGIFTAFGVLFTFWSITHFGRHILQNKDKEISNTESFAIILAGFVGALACTFATSVWFSAVEGEVYAMSFGFTGLTFWSALKYYEDETERADKWFIFIAYSIGLSIGVHLLSLLTIPAVVLVYFLKRNKGNLNLTGYLKALGTGIIILGFIQMILIPKIPAIAALFDRIFVNSFHLPFGTGILFAIILFISAIYFGLKYAHKTNKPILEHAILSTFMLLLGFSTYLMIVIRANANTSINMNRPTDAYSLLSYINREQYGDRPLVKGEWWGAAPTDQTEGKAIWRKDKDEYKLDGYRPEYVYDESDKMLFPRLGSHDPSHARLYQNFLGLSPEDKPSMGDNIKFFIGYQFRHMYWRYFMWNFAGRQNDKQGIGGRDVTQGNWITGIKAYDSMRLYDWSNAPKTLQGNPAENKYYLIPFILGLIGLYFHFKKRNGDAWLVLLLWFFTGIAIMIFLNNPPIEPRERDYGFAGSVMAYCMWIGLAVIAIFDYLRNKIGEYPSVIASSVICLSAPLIMVQQNWDDHNRGNRYAARDYASNFLNSVEKNAILFTIGDNDTYPLWYAQEVEGVRRDVRIVNLSLLAVDWYIDQLYRKVYDSPAVKLSFPKEKIQGSKRDFIPFYEIEGAKNSTVSLTDVLAYAFSDNPNTMQQLTNGEMTNVFPARNFSILVDTQKILSQHMIDPANRKKLVKEMKFTKKGSGVMKNDLLVLDIINSNINDRPVYFATTIPDENFNGLDKYLQLEGLAMRVVPVEGEVSTNGATRASTVYADKIYENVMQKFKWGNVDKEKVYLDPAYNPALSNITSSMLQGAKTFIERGDKQKALALSNKYLQVFPEKNRPLDYFAMDVIEILYAAGDSTQAHKLSVDYAKKCDRELKYYFNLPDDVRDAFTMEINMGAQSLQNLMQYGVTYKDEKLTKEVMPLFEYARKKYTDLGFGKH
jgi:hypothetical protein